jgi:integrase
MYEQKGRRIFKTLGDPFVHEIDRDMLSGYVARRLNAEDEEHGQASPHTVSKELITIRRALREANDRGVLQVMPKFPRFSPRYVPREVWLTEAQYTLLCAELEPRRVLWVSLAALGGLRAGEVERLQWSNAFERLMRVPGTKTDDARRTIPIAPALKYQLDQVPTASRRGRIVQPWGNVRRDLRAAVARANRKLAAAAAELGVEPEVIPFVSPNDLRRTFASWLVQCEVPLHVIAKLLGHSSTRMVEKVYGKLSQRNMDEAIAVLPTFEAHRELPNAERPALTAGPGDSAVTTVCAQGPGSGANCRLPDTSGGDDFES